MCTLHAELHLENLPKGAKIGFLKFLGGDACYVFVLLKFQGGVRFVNGGRGGGGGRFCQGEAATPL